MIFSYAITVCNESKEFYELMCFLNKVVDFKKHELVVLLDTGKVTQEVYDVIDKFPPHKLFSRRFDGDFSTHRNFLIDRCNGDYIFMIDADEVPQQKLVENLENIININQCDVLFVPKMNICPGWTKEWIRTMGFSINENGWINWPDYQGRIFKNNKQIKFENKCPERICGFRDPTYVHAKPTYGLWHIKSVWRQTGQKVFYEQLQDNN